MASHDIKPIVSTQHEEEVKEKQAYVALKSDHDNLTTWETIKLFRKAVLVCSSLCIAAAADGYQYTLNGNVIANTGFIQHIGFPNPTTGKYALKAEYTALWGAMQSLGQLVGMLTLNPLSDRLGRKMTLYVLWVILLGSLLIETFVENWKQWAGAKLIAGIGIGAIQSTLPIYITEWSPVNIRGMMATAYGVWNYIGCFLAPLVLYICQATDASNWKTPILTQWAFLGIMLPIFIWLPETPAYFAAKGQHEKGIATLRRINGKVQGYDVETEYAIIQNTIAEEQQMKRDMGLERQGLRELANSYIDCFRGNNWKRTIGAAMTLSVQQLTGLSFLSTYSSLFFRQSGFDNPFQITSVTYAIKLGTVIIICLTTDRLGRRPTVLTMGTLCSVCLLIVGALGQVEKTSGVKSGLVALACFWSIGNAAMGCIGWSMVGEIASQQLRARTAGIAAAITVIFGLTFNTSVPIMLDVNKANMGYKTAWVFFGTSIVILALAWLLLPEPARRNGAEMDEMYEKKVPAWRMRNYITDVQRNHAEQYEGQKL